VRTPKSDYSLVERLLKGLGKFCFAVIKVALAALTKIIEKTSISGIEPIVGTSILSPSLAFSFNPQKVNLKDGLDVIGAAFSTSEG
jgi:hypothetical protein